MRHLSPRDLAEALGVSESSLKRWVDAGKISATRTDGGHRRIPLAEAVRFIRETGAPLAHPELLGMPEVEVARQRALDGDARLLDLLRNGDGIGVRGWMLSSYLAGTSVPDLCDGPVREAMHALGELWRHGEHGIFVEHRATDMCLQALAHLRNTFEPRSSAAIALGGTPEGDPYLLPTFIAATVIAATGMRAVNLGPDTPIAAMHHAVAEHRPRLVWISSSAPIAPARARTIGQWLASLPASIEVVIGGRSSETISEAQPGIRRLETMGELSALAAGLAT